MSAIKAEISDLNKEEEKSEMKSENDYVEGKLIKEEKMVIVNQDINQELTLKEIKEFLSCAICSDICKRGITVTCCNSQACRVCASKRITQFSSKCWFCDKKIVEKDFQTDYDLRQAVLELTNNQPYSETSQAYFRKRILEISISVKRKQQFELKQESINQFMDIPEEKNIKEIKLECEEYQEKDSLNDTDEIFLEEKQSCEQKLNEKTDECKVFIAIECLYHHVNIYLTQIAAICSDSEENFHVVNEHIPKGYRKNEKLLKYFNLIKIKNNKTTIRILHEGTQIDPTINIECIPRFLNFIRNLVTKKQKEDKKVTLVLYSKYEVWCILSLMKWELIELDINIVCLSPEDKPPNLSEISNDYHDSMLVAANILKEYAKTSSAFCNVVPVPLTIIIKNKATISKDVVHESNLFQLISPMNIPNYLFLSIGYWHQEENLLRGLKSCNGADPISEEHKGNTEKCKHCQLKRKYSSNIEENTEKQVISGAEFSTNKHSPRKKLKLTNCEVFHNKCYKCQNLSNQEPHYGKDCKLYKNNPKAYQLCERCGKGAHPYSFCKQYEGFVNQEAISNSEQLTGSITTPSSIEELSDKHKTDDGLYEKSGRKIKISKEHVSMLKNKCYKCQNLSNQAPHFGDNCELYKDTPKAFYICKKCGKGVHLPYHCKQNKKGLSDSGPLIESKSISSSIEENKVKP